MNYLKEYIFPTPIHLFDNILEKEDINSIKKDIYNCKDIDKTVNWQSDSFLHTKSQYKSLTEKIIKSVELVLESYQYEYDTFIITGMWANILKTNEFHRPHTHSNNILSGVYYVESDESVNINFIDPRPQANVFEPTIKSFNVENSSRYFYPSLENRLIIFPSWLQHYVSNNKSKLNRVSIAFNIMLKGKINVPESLQSSIF